MIYETDKMKMDMNSFRGVKETDSFVVQVSAYGRLKAPYNIVISNKDNGELLKDENGWMLFNDLDEAYRVAVEHDALLERENEAEYNEDY